MMGCAFEFHAHFTALYKTPENPGVVSLVQVPIAVSTSFMVRGLRGWVSALGSRGPSKNLSSLSMIGGGGKKDLKSMSLFTVSETVSTPEFRSFRVGVPVQQIPLNHAVSLQTSQLDIRTAKAMAQSLFAFLMTRLSSLAVAL